MNAEHQQYYLRAEPSAEGRRTLRRHQQRLTEVFEGLRLNPRLTKADDLHWTTVFLGSPQRWTRAFRAVGVDVELTADALLELAMGNHAHQLPKITPANFGSLSAQPTTYDVFFNAGTNAVFVLRLGPDGASPARVVLDHLRERLFAWERSGRLPGGTTPKLFRHPNFPLARDVNGGRPHMTLARGRVSRERQRDVLRSVHATRLATREPISFQHPEIRIVHSPAMVRVHA